MKLIETIGATSRIWQIFIADSSSTTGGGLTGLTSASAGLTAYYHRDTDTTATAISLVTMTVGTFTSSGFKEIDATNMPGWYQLCPPNAAIASGAKSVGVHLKGATNMAPLPIEVQLTAFDFTVATQSVSVAQWNGTNVSAPSTAGIPEVNIKNIANAAVSTSTAQLGVNVVNIKGSASAGTAGQVALDFTSPTIPVGAVPALGWVDNGTLQSATSTTAVIRSAASFGDNTLVGHFVWIIAGTGAAQSRLITANVGSTDTLTVDTWTVTPDNTSSYAIAPTPPGSASSLTPVNVTAWNGTAVSSPATAGIPDVNVKNINNVATTSVTTVSANQGTTQPLNFTGTSSSALVKTDVVDFGGTAGTFTSGKPDVQNVAGSVAGNVSGNVNGTVSQIGSGGITNASFAADTGLKPIRTGTAQAGASTSITLDAGASSVDGFYNNTLILLTGGTGAAQSRYVTGYTGASKIATVAAWVTNPNNTSTFAILPGDSIPGATAPTSAANADAVWNRLESAITTVGSIGLALVTNVDATISSRLAPASPGRTLDVSATHEAAIDWSRVGSPSTSVNLSGTTVNALTNAAAVGGLTATMKTDAANAVLDALAADHNTASTIGAKINSAGSAGDPLANPVPGTYPSGTAGYALGNVPTTTTIVPVNVKKINDVTINGSGVSGNPFEP